MDLWSSAGPLRARARYGVGAMGASSRDVPPAMVFRWQLAGATVPCRLQLRGQPGEAEVNDDVQAGDPDAYLFV